MMKKIVLLTLIPMTLTLQGAFVMKKGQSLEKIDGSVQETQTVNDTQANVEDTTSKPSLPSSHVETPSSGTNIDTTVPIWIIGDSTVSNYPDNNTIKGKGWGQVIADIIRNPNRVDNRAMPGTSSKSYAPLRKNQPHNRFWGDGKTDTNAGNSGLKEDILKANISKGGYLLIQFGHNDEYGNRYDASVDTVPGKGNEFDKELMKYITFSKKHNITPVLITSMARMSYGNKYPHITGSLGPSPAPWQYMQGKKGDWPQTMRDVAKREKVILLDLTARSLRHYNDDFTSRQAIINSYSWNKSDGTHFNKQGAKKMAQFIKELACDINNGGNRALCNQFK